MQRRHFLLALASLVSLPFSQRLFAHHGWSSFDETRPLYIVGTVKSIEWQNPHAEIVVTMTNDAALPADLATRSIPAQTAAVNGAKILAEATLPKKRGDWKIELSPMNRINAWNVPRPRIGDSVAAVAYTFKDENGAALARVEYLLIGDKIFGLRSLPV
jgi:hypothetical protein